MFPRKGSAMNMFYSFEQHITQDGEKAIKANVKVAFGEILRKRTYFFKVVNNEEFQDDYADTYGRKCFRAALYCFEYGLHSEALGWYLEGHKAFVGNSDCEVFKDGADIVLRYDPYSVQWYIYATTWLNTMYGSIKKWMIVGYLNSYVEHSLDEGMLEKRQLNWENMISLQREIIKKNAEELAESFKYDDKNEVKI